MHQKTKQVPFSSVMLGSLPSHACSNSTSPDGHRSATALCHSGLRNTKTTKAFPSEHSVCPISCLERLKSSHFPHNKIKVGAGRRGEQGRDGAACGAELPASRSPPIPRQTRLQTDCLSSIFPFQHFPHPPAKKTLRAASCPVWRANCPVFPNRAAPESTACIHRGTVGLRPF